MYHIGLGELNASVTRCRGYSDGGCSYWVNTNTPRQHHQTKVHSHCIGLIGLPPKPTCAHGARGELYELHSANPNPIAVYFIFIRAVMKLNNEEMAKLHCMSPEQRAKALMAFSSDDRAKALQMLNDRDREATLAVMPKDDLYKIDMRRGGLSHHGRRIRRDPRGVALTMTGKPQLRPMNTFPKLVQGHLPPPRPEELAHALPYGGYPERLVGDGMGVGKSGLEYQTRSIRKVFEHALGEMGPGAQPVVHKVTDHGSPPLLLLCDYSPAFAYS